MVVEFVMDDMSCLVSSSLDSMCCFNGVVLLQAVSRKRFETSTGRWGGNEKIDI